ncbi:hypothetical protein F4V43_02050 [Paenibacillus spiritus]|uniref:Uncharacterized protein n=1 Tax=Paenibacillus spiritus TaxID=2496557 RepID=A0A5J5GHV8_9BACL|nr:hypothetical protein [Paenibacillus spiritus]KAA9007292.1 hypothetical protein F4V43_02050 [Paenibacillus spiritus]
MRSVDVFLYDPTNRLYSFLQLIWIRMPFTEYELDIASYEEWRKRGNMVRFKNYVIKEFKDKGISKGETISIIQNEFEERGITFSELPKIIYKIWDE